MRNQWINMIDVHSFRSWWYIKKSKVYKIVQFWIRNSATQGDVSELIKRSLKFIYSCTNPLPCYFSLHLSPCPSKPLTVQLYRVNPLFLSVFALKALWSVPQASFFPTQSAATGTTTLQSTVMKASNVYTPLLEPIILHWKVSVLILTRKMFWLL